MNAYLRIEKLEKRFDENGPGVVDRLSFEVKKGEIVSVVGENGSGKTTLMKLISGMLEPDEGSVFLNGEKVLGPAHNLVPGHPEIAIIHQKDELFPHHTVAQNLEQAIPGYDTEEIRNRTLMDMMNFCHILEFKDKFPGEMSGGQKQRVNIARALITSPSVLLMDEAFSSLDHYLHQEMRHDIFQILRKSGVTVLMVTHNPNEAIAFSDRILVIRNGQLLQYETPEVLYSNPANPYIARFFGTVSHISAASSLQLMGIEKTCFIRPEHIMINDKGSECTVERIYFQGSYDEVYANFNQERIILHTKRGKLKKGEKIRISIRKDEVSYFDNPDQ